jgi:hypothetical protein
MLLPAEQVAGLQLASRAASSRRTRPSLIASSGTRWRRANKFSPLLALIQLVNSMQPITCGSWYAR